jgi:NAD(P)-dependent dehydrogenase (short-subunit alcohol dehydrogenase family)
MTGCSSGIGKVGAARLMERGYRVIGGVCDEGSPAVVEERPLELSDLESVRAFATELRDIKIDALLLNAGVQVYDLRARTKQGLERTFGVNHLGHYLLARLLVPQVVNGGAVVFTTSATHDPAEKIGMPTPRHARAEWLAYPERDPEVDCGSMKAGLRAYTASKLCNVMTARTMAKGPDVMARGLRVHAFDPGLVAGTGLVRTGPLVLRRAIWPMLSWMKPVLRGSNGVAEAGRALADLGDGTADVGDEVYCSLRGGRLVGMSPSVMAQDDAACERLWQESAVIARLEPDIAQ